MALIDVAEEAPEHARGLARRGSGGGDLDGVAAEVGQLERAQQQATVGVWVRPHPPVAARRERGQLGAQGAAGVEQLLGLV